MKKIFFASLFKEVAHILESFANENLVGKTVTFIPTAALSDKLDFHIKYSKELLTEMGLIVDESEISKKKRHQIFFLHNRRYTPPPPKHNHCCNPHQHCGGQIKLAFAAKKARIGGQFGGHERKKASCQG